MVKFSEICGSCEIEVDVGLVVIAYFVHLSYLYVLNIFVVGSMFERPPL